MAFILLRKVFLSMIIPCSAVSGHPVADGTSGLTARAVTLCGQYAYAQSANGYHFNNNIWGASSAFPGYSQCLEYRGQTSVGVSFSATWNFTGNPHSVKSYPYAGRNIWNQQRLNQISRLPTAASWNYTRSDLRANVMYDLFTAADPKHVTSSGDFEIMVWLARINDAYPIGWNKGQPVASPNLTGSTWDLFEGYNGDMKAWTFMARSPVRDYQGDMKEFFDYVTRFRGFPASQQYLLTFQFGTEAFSGGPATFTVANFSAAIV